MKNPLGPLKTTLLDLRQPAGREINLQSNDSRPSQRNVLFSPKQSNAAGETAGTNGLFKIRVSNNHEESARKIQQ